MMVRSTGSIVVLALCLAASAEAQNTVAAAAQSAVPFTAGLSTPEAFRAAVEGRIGRARGLLDGMIAVRGRRTIDNTLTPYDEMWGELFTAAGQTSVFAANHPDARMRTMAEDLNRSVSALSSEVPLRPDVFAALAGIDLTRADAPTRFYVERELRDFRLAGVDKPDATRQRIQQLRAELTAVTDQFNRNVRGARGSIVVPNAAALDGLPADFIARHKPDAGGAITLTTDDADARPVLTYAKSADLRRRMMIATYNVGAPANLAVVERMLRVRYDLANALGFPNWAAVDAASRSVGTPGAASRFIDRVVEASGQGAARDYAELLARKQLDEPGSKFEIWDRTYYSDLVRKASYNFDSRTLRPYFPFDRVLQGTLDVTARIFGLTYTPATGVDVWHPSVRVYDVREQDTLIGRVYLDLHPRPNKVSTRGNVSTVRYGQAGRSIPEAVATATLPGGDGDPGLMTHDEVIALFHELGHVVHRLRGGHQPWQRLSSLALERDFTEAPSQMLEEWMWDPATLATFARHYRTGEPIPAALVHQLRAASRFGQALEVRGQMVLARVALSYHDRDPRGLDTTRLWKEIHDRYMPVSYPDDGHRQASFPHLSNSGYASAYYSYMWSLVIAKDMFSTFEGADLQAPGVARRYLETVFAQGSTKPAAMLVTEFLGRPFSFDAWARWLNQPVAGSR